MEATQKGLEIKRLFDQAVKLDPGAARAWVGLGTWNAQALALGPLVRFATGASESGHAGGLPPCHWLAAG